MSSRPALRQIDLEPDDQSPPQPQRAVQSVEVGGRLLLALGNSPAAMTLKDLAAKADLSPSRAHPYLVSFGKLGLIEQDRESGRYALGPAALQLGLTCLHQLDPIKAALPIAQALAATTGQAVALAVWGNFGPTIVRMIDARQPLHLTMRAGTVMSVLGTATGRAFAAVLPAARIVQSLGRPLGDDPHLLAQPSRLRRRGLARGRGRGARPWRGARGGAAGAGRQRLQRAGLRPRGRSGPGDHAAGSPGPLVTRLGRRARAGRAPGRRRVVAPPGLAGGLIR